jgi:hypothetical protein
VRGLQAKGFLQDWLLLLPLPIKPEDIWSAHLEQGLLPNEANPKPQAGQRVDREFIWQ